MSTPGQEPPNQSQAQDQPRSVRVLCVEDLRAVAESICDVVDHEPDMESVGILATPDHLDREVRRLSANVVLLDLYFAGRTAFPALAELLRAEPSVRVIVVSGDNHPHTIARAFALGASGYVVKGDLSEVIDAIRATMQGRFWHPGGAAP